MRNHRNPRRRLLVERLDARLLLAADLNVHHNFHTPEDVDHNGQITPRDVLIQINALNDHLTAVTDFLPDVNADGRLTPIDPLIVINRLEEHANDIVASSVSLEARIDRIRDAIAENVLPPHFDSDRATAILETL